MGLALTGLVLWMTAGRELGSQGESIQETASGAVDESRSVEQPSSSAPFGPLVAGQRWTIAEEDLPEDGVLVLTLDVPDEARGTGRRRVVIVSTMHGRFETAAVPLPGADAGMRLEIGRDDLSRGLYMIEIETDDGPPHVFRRFVMEIE
jgi:hypothetical protein